MAGHTLSHEGSPGCYGAWARAVIVLLASAGLLMSGCGKGEEKARPEKVVNFYDYTHNDYAQFAAEAGLLGLAMMGLVVAMSLGAALRAQWVRHDPLMRGMAFASTMGITAILIHSWVDFNLQIPANALLFMVILALGWISLHLDRREG